MNRTLAAASTVVLAVALSGCYSVKDPVPASPSTAPTAEALPDKCLTPTEGAISKLQDDITATMGDVSFTGHGVVKSESGEEFWYIAIEFEDDESSYTGTWGTMQDPTTNDDIAYISADDMAPLVSTYKQPVKMRGVTSSLIGADDCIPR